ncbi:drug resistance transporter, EmrB/QacA subfamily [Lentibacillus persicus]|uniref:Drug resistance transporter, EmrB/QacA subfamily n=1 Tax=Lentibacillus persicus TaxID=640948 RepID=A0A1I2A4V7_9BACI|nr:MFS transporter [Lentibacillus persicus]SFE38837.1 drug resistance transporter, EmrB/QacA subfamily [Lentibacillus persicus]
MATKIHKPWLLVLTVGLGTLLNPLNSSMISVALTRLQEAFALSFADASWLISIFYLASAAGQPVMGKLSDMFGPKRLFMAGLILVAGASVLAPLSPNFPVLLACRALQAIGSSTLFPSGMSMVRAHITKKQGRALAVLAIFSTTSAAFGPSIGGFLIGAWDWQSIFLINFPFIIISFTLALFILPNTGQGKIDIKRIDFVGIILFIAFTTGMILFILSLNGSIRWWAFVLFVFGGVAFYMFEQKQSEPFIDTKSLTRNRNSLAVYIQFMTINLIYYCYFYGFPTFLQQVKGYSEENTGLIMLTLAGFGVVTAPIAGRLIDRYGSKLPLIIGASVLLSGTALVLTYQTTSPIIWLMIIMSLIGMSQGFNNISTQTALYENVSREETGSASGLYQTSRYVGAILSSSLLGLTFNDHMDLAHLHLVALICLMFCLVVLVLAIKLPGRKKAEDVG